MSGRQQKKIKKAARTRNETAAEVVARPKPEVQNVPCIVQVQAQVWLKQDGSVANIKIDEIGIAPPGKVDGWSRAQILEVQKIVDERQLQLATVVLTKTLENMAEAYSREAVADQARQVAEDLAAGRGPSLVLAPDGQPARRE